MNNEDMDPDDVTTEEFPNYSFSSYNDILVLEREPITQPIDWSLKGLIKQVFDGRWRR